MDQHTSFCTPWNRLIEQILKMTIIGVEGAKNIALWILSKKFGNNLAISLHKSFQAETDNIEGPKQCQSKGSIVLLLISTLQYDFPI